jgi:GT2 family glycosyltransferase
LLRLDYPNYEVIVVNDGSTDSTAEIATSYGFRVITTENRGLSSARNIGLNAATGEIVAYIDDDAYADPHWLRYIAGTFMNTRHVGVGGPNIAPATDGPIAECVAHSPGNPVHILLSDSEAEHIPGCNMAFRKVALEAIGGFDPQFRIAGDDVDVCWRLQQKGWTLGYSPGAMVWHHRRNSIRAYWKQQHNYGKAESFLEKKWPRSIISLVTSHGQDAFTEMGINTKAWSQGRIYHGVWGSAPFQSIYQGPAWHIGILAIYAGMVLGRRRARADLRTWFSLVSIILRSASFDLGALRADLSGRVELTTSSFSSIRKVALGADQTAQHHRTASSTPAFGAAHGTGPFGSDFLAI